MRIELAETAERHDSGKRVHTDDAEPGAAHLHAGKPVQQLKQLKLVQKVVLKPEHHLVIALRGREMFVSQTEVAENLVVGHRWPGEIARSDLRRGAKIKTGGKRSLRHWVSPWQYIVVRTELLQRVGSVVTVRDVKAGPHVRFNLSLQYRVTL